MVLKQPIYVPLPGLMYCWHVVSLHLGGIPVWNNRISTR